MSAKAEISYYCDRCGRMLCEDHEIICGRCYAREQNVFQVILKNEYELKIEDYEYTIRELEDTIEKLNKRIEELMDDVGGEK